MPCRRLLPLCLASLWAVGPIGCAAKLPEAAAAGPERAGLERAEPQPLGPPPEPRRSAHMVAPTPTDAPLVQAKIDIERYDMSGPSITAIPFGASQATIVAALVGVDGLRQLNLGGTQIVDLHHIARLSSVESLILWDSFVIDLDPIRGFDALRLLDIRGTGVDSLAPISGAVELTQLLASETNVRSLAPLTKLTQLEILDLAHTPVRDLTPLADLDQLTVLHLDHTAIRSVSALTKLKRLRTLSLAGTNIRDVRPLLGLAHLEALDLADTPIKSVSELRTLQQLKTLDLRGTRASARQIAELEAAMPFTLVLDDAWKREQGS